MRKRMMILVAIAIMFFSCEISTPKKEQDARANAHAYVMRGNAKDRLGRYFEAIQDQGY